MKKGEGTAVKAAERAIKKVDGKPQGGTATKVRPGKN